MAPTRYTGVIRRIAGTWTQEAQQAIRELVQDAESLLILPGSVRRVEVLIWRPTALYPSLADLEEIVLLTEKNPRAVVLDREELEWYLPDTALEPLARVIAEEIRRHRSQRLYWLVYAVKPK